MTTASSFRHPLWLFLAGLLCAAGTWTYASRVLVPYQIADAEAHGRPRGSFSDLYPSWVGARELLLQSRDPYGAEITREIQAGYYGQPLDASQVKERRDEQRFAYPVYELLLLAPAMRLPFPLVQKGFFWMMVVLTAASVWVWMRVLQWPAHPMAQITAITLTLGSAAVMQGLKLQQVSLLVAGLIAFAVLLLSKGHPLPAGVLLALACIKPQLVLLLLLWLGIWTLADLRRRYLWAVSFLVTMGLLLAASEWLLPHWIPRFWEQARAYHTYADAVGVMEKLVGLVLGGTLELLALATMVGICWRERRSAANTGAFAFTSALVLAITTLLVPKYAPYNHVLLLPAVLVLVEDRHTLWRQSWASRVLFATAAILVCWPWFASVALAALSFILPQQSVERAWAVPGWTALPLPVGVAAVMLVHAWRLPFAAPASANVVECQGQVSRD